jgi:hypothetical protein
MLQEMDVRMQVAGNVAYPPVGLVQIPDNAELLVLQRSAMLGKYVLAHGVAVMKVL